MATAAEVMRIIPGQDNQQTGTATRSREYGPPTATPTPVPQSQPSPIGSAGVRLLELLVSSSDIQTEIAVEFSELANRWHRETGMYSLSIQKTSHPAYLRIVGMGSRAIPFILKDLRQHGGHWYQALESILGYSPVQIDEPGNIRQIKAQWLAWGHRAGHL